MGRSNTPGRSGTSALAAATAVRPVLPTQQSWPSGSKLYGYARRSAANRRPSRREFSSKAFDASAAESNYILETTSTGAGIFGAARDNDILVVNGSTFSLAEFGKSPPSMLYVNDAQGRFTYSAIAKGLAAKGRGQGVRVGDFDNDGSDDLAVTDRLQYEHTYLYYLYVRMHAHYD